MAIIGGSVAGSEAAYLLAEKGVRVVVFDQKNLPYGKIEDGLPSGMLVSGTRKRT